MILLLQLLAVIGSASLALVFLLLVVGPPLAAAFRGGSFNIKLWHAVAFAALASVALWLAVTFGWVTVR